MLDNWDYGIGGTDCGSMANPERLVAESAAGTESPWVKAAFDLGEVEEGVDGIVSLESFQSIKDSWLDG